MSIKASIESIGTGNCALTGKPETDGLTVAFEGEKPAFLSWKAFKQLISLKAAQTPKADPQPRPVPVASPANGPVVAAPK